MTIEHTRTYWVTGAGTGIGRSLVRRLCEQGHTVAVTGRRVEPLQELASQYPYQIVIQQADVSDNRAMRKLFSDCWINQLDGVFLSAGICEYIDVHDPDHDSFKRVMDINFHGVVNSCSAAMPLLENCVLQGGRPFIAGVSSMSTYVGLPRAEAYAASKAAMAAYLDCLRCDVGKDMDVTVIYPGFVDTPLTQQNDFPMPVLVSAGQAAKIILHRMEKRPLVIHFPWRLHIMLRLAAMFPGMWYRYAVSRLSRNKSHKRTQELSS